ncbi:hypothetical protein WJX79_001117 [Trebouxia sp. C0005]
MTKLGNNSVTVLTDNLDDFAVNWPSKLPNPGRVVSVSKCLEGTPLRGWLDSPELASSRYRQQNIANALRLAALYKSGGIYLDLDIIPLHKELFESDLASISQQCEESECGNAFFLNNAYLSFPAKDRFLHKLMETFVVEYQGSIWGFNGPRLVSSLYKRSYITSQQPCTQVRRQQNGDGAPLLKGKRKGVTGKTPGLQIQRTDAVKPGLGSTSSFQEFGLAEIPAVSRRSPAGFGFDMDALLDDSDASQSKPERRKHSLRGPSRSNSKEQITTVAAVKPLSQSGHTFTTLDNSNQTHHVSNQSQEGASANPPRPVAVDIARSSADDASVVASVADEGTDLLDIIGGADTQSSGLRRAASAGRRASIQQKPASRVDLPTAASLLSYAHNSPEVEQALETRGAVQGLKGTDFSQQLEQQNEQPSREHNSSVIAVQQATPLGSLSGPQDRSSNMNFEKPIELPLPVLPSPQLAAGLAAETAAVVEQSKHLSEATAAVSKANAERDHLKLQLQAAQSQLAQQARAHSLEQVQLAEKASAQSAQVTHTAAELQEAKSALNAAQAQTAQLQTQVQEMQKQMADVSLDKQDLQQAAQLQQQLQRALQEQQHMAARLQQDWQQHEAKLTAREEKLEERERAVTDRQAEAAALKAELQSLADTVRTQTEKQVKDSAEDKLAASRHQARLDTLQAVMADEVGQVRMQVQLEKEALERARTQRAADREAWSQQVTNEQKQLAQETVESQKSLEAARTAELTARKAALEFEARASLALKEAEGAKARSASTTQRLQADQDAYEGLQKAMTADRDEIARQGAALVEMGKQIQTKSEAVAAAWQLMEAQKADLASQQNKVVQQSIQLDQQTRQVQQQMTALQAAQAGVWAERSQLVLEQQAVAEDKARAVQHAQEAATAHTKLLAQFKQARMQSVLVPRDISSDEEIDIVWESPRKILAAVQNKASSARSWSSRHQSRATLMSPTGPYRGSSASQHGGYQQAVSKKQQSPPHFGAAVSPLKHPGVACSRCSPSAAGTKSILP